MSTGKLKRDDELILEISGLDEQGSAYGSTTRIVAEEPRHYRVHVPGAIPGDTVRAEVTKVRKRRASARGQQLLSASSQRISSRCAHAFRLAEAGPFCGGCGLQHMAYSAQLEAKYRWVETYIEAAGLEHVTVQPVISAKSEWGYRNKMEYSCTRNREGVVALGLYPRGYRYEVMSLSECHLQSESSSKLLVALGDWIRDLQLLPHGLGRSEAPGFVRTITIREGKRTGDRMVELTTSGDEDTWMRGERVPASAIADAFSQFIIDYGDVTSWHWTRHHAAKGVRTRFETVHLGGKTALHEELHIAGRPPLRFEVHPRAFFQPNTLQAEVLYGEVHRAALTDGTLGRALDLYCGTGTIGLSLTHVAEQVLGIELNEEAVENARKNAVDNHIENATFYAGDAAVVLSTLGLGNAEMVDLVIVDPPRNGLSEAAVNQVVSVGAPTVVYVSCNPKSLARDLVLFHAHGYRAESVQPVDMFPHTFHIESVVRLQRD